MTTAGATLRLRRESTLRSRAARGDAVAFAAVYERHHQALYRYCRSILHHEEDAQDALQSTMARAFAALQDEQRDFELRPWLFRIAHNEAISILRKRRTTTELDDIPVLGDLEDRVSEREELRLLAMDLADLPDRQRAALVLRELNGLSHAEIAVVLETSAANVKQTIYEARSALFSAREGREMLCDDVRRMLSDGDGRVLRGRGVRAHLRSCSGCRRFQADIGQRSKRLAMLAPPLPTAGAAALLAQIIGGGGAAKLLACVAVAGGGATVAAVEFYKPPPRAVAESPSGKHKRAPAPTATPTPVPTATPGVVLASSPEEPRAASGEKQKAEPAKRKAKKQRARKKGTRSAPKTKTVTQAPAAVETRPNGQDRAATKQPKAEKPTKDKADQPPKREKPAKVEREKPAKVEREKPAQAEQGKPAKPEKTEKLVREKPAKVEHEPPGKAERERSAGPDQDRPDKSKRDKRGTVEPTPAPPVVTPAPSPSEPRGEGKADRPRGDGQRGHGRDDEDDDDDG